jgi:hypothetical protein
MIRSHIASGTDSAAARNAFSSRSMPASMSWSRCSTSPSV